MLVLGLDIVLVLELEKPLEGLLAGFVDLDMGDPRMGFFVLGIVQVGEDSVVVEAGSLVAEEDCSTEEE